MTDTPIVDIIQTIKASNGFPARFEFRFAWKTNNPARMPSVYITANTMEEAIKNFKDFFEFLENESLIWESL